MEFGAKAVINIDAINAEFNKLYEQLQKDMAEVMRRNTNIISQMEDVVNPPPPDQEEKKEQDGQA